MDGGLDPVAIVSAVIAGFSLLVSGGALWFARRADKRAERAERRAECADRRADRGQPSAQYLSSRIITVRGRDTELVKFMFHITNVGAAGARHITVRLRDQTGVELPEQSGRVSLPGGGDREVTVTVRDPRRYSYPLKVQLQWQHWEHQEPLNIHDSSEMVPSPF
jgi:hypothetical protein